MCTLMLAHRATPGTPLAVSGNRNEFLERPASGPVLWSGEPAVVAPRDGKAGGTWLGVNGHGVFVCLTNRRKATLDSARLSRGLLVAEVLRLPSARAIHEHLGRLSAERHNGFHLVAADRREAFLSISDGVVLERRQLAPGVHIVTERTFGAGEGLREKAAAAAFAEIFAAGEPSVEALRGPMQAHGPLEEPLESACVHAELFGYGTRSSFQLVVPISGPVAALWTEGPPCTQPAHDISALVQPLFSSR